MSGFSAYLRVKDVGVVQCVVGKDVGPVVDLRERQVHRGNGARSHEASRLGSDVGEPQKHLCPNGSLLTADTQPQESREQMYY